MNKINSLILLLLLPLFTVANAQEVDTVFSQAEFDKLLSKNVQAGDKSIFYQSKNNDSFISYDQFYVSYISGSKGEQKLLKNPEFITALFSGEDKAKKENNKKGLKIIKTARKIIVTDKEIIRGSCWDWPHTVFIRAGFPLKKSKRIFKGSYGTKPYAPTRMFKQGDWLYFVNLSYYNSAHSAIFIDWLDREKNIALLASYGGENRNHPARYRAYDVSQVYGVFRPK